jgi:hypothetical protein
VLLFFALLHSRSDFRQFFQLEWCHDEPKFCIINLPFYVSHQENKLSKAYQGKEHIILHTGRPVRDELVQAGGGSAAEGSGLSIYSILIVVIITF